MSNGMHLEGRDLPLHMQEQAAMAIINQDFKRCFAGKFKIKSGNEIPMEERQKIYSKAIEVWGRDLQMVVAVEELSECQKEICKMIRGNENTLHLAEEIADAAVMLEQITLMFDIRQEVCSYMDAKIKRLAERVNHNDAEM